jgi:polysaccharide export outer membrane protein
MRFSKSGLRRLNIFSAVMVIFLVGGIVLSSSTQAQTAPDAAIVPSVPTAEQSVTPQVPTPITEDKPDTEKKPQDEGQSSTIRLGPGDLVEVSVYGVPELATKARVSNDGDLYLPLIDYVHVADLGLEEAQKLIEKRLDDGGFVRNPHVTIFVNDYASQGVTILGEVARPGIYPTLGERRLFDLFSAAGGLTEKASRTVSISRRNKPDEPQIIRLARNLTDDPASNVQIKPGDTIEIQRAPIVYVVGDVGRPSGLLIDNGNLTVLQAVALVGGPNHTAKLDGTRIIRKSEGPNGMTETIVPLKKMLRAKAPDVPLQANDILFIPVSGAKIAAARTMQTALALTTAVAIYAVRP